MSRPDKQTDPSPGADTGLLTEPYPAGVSGPPWLWDLDSEALDYFKEAHMSTDELAAQADTGNGTSDYKPCKIDGCANPSIARAGFYALLCETHKQEAQQARARQARRHTARPAPPAKHNGTPATPAAITAAAARVAETARAYDQALAELRSLLT